MPIGQEAGVTSSASDCSISSNRSNGSRPSRSSLLTKVMIGTSRKPADLEELAGLLLDALGAIGGGVECPNPPPRAGRGGWGTAVSVR